MDMTGERQIAASREAVWAALNDPKVLQACIPGCESLEKTSATEMTATAAIRLGPVAARFSGKLHLSDLDPPNGYKLSGEGQGGPAGAAKGGAEVRLEDRDGGTRLSYTVKAQVGGKIAQVGGRLIDATAKGMADQFFNRFVERLENPEAAAAKDARSTEDNATGLPLRFTSADYLAGVLTGLGVAGLFTLALRLVDGGRPAAGRRRR
jgi:uncharacterized protein